MSYKLTILRRSQKELSALAIQDYTRIKNAIKQLSEEPRPVGCLKLIDRNGWRIRVGDYRIVYEIDDMQCELTVIHIGHRKDVYR